MFHHITVLLQESIDGLNIKSDGIYVDCTLGGAGHSSLILEKLTTGHLYCFDQDQVAIDNAQIKLSKISNNFTIIKSNFEFIQEKLLEHGVSHVDGILYDLGVSSPQLDTPERGFSYNFDARLDMRMDNTNPLSAYEVVNEYDFNQLVSIFYRYGEENFAKQIARKIEQARAIKPIETTFELVELIKAGIPAAKRRTGGHPAKKVFQAIRIEVNQELTVFERSLYKALDLLNPQGRIAVITFHSLEDRICKNIFSEVTKKPKVVKDLPIFDEQIQMPYTLITRKPIVPSDQELDENNRSRSSKLRIIEKN